MAKDGAVGPVTVGYTSPGGIRMVNLPDEQKQQVAFVPAEIPVVILAGGKGTRLHDISKGVIPKPMVRLGGIPFLEHIIGIYSAQGFRKFYVAAGYLSEVITDWIESSREKYRVLAVDITVVDTGVDTQTGGRLLRLAGQLAGNAFFMMTYGDGFADVNMAALLEFHNNLMHNNMPNVTLTAANPPARFGNLKITDGKVSYFGEKSQVLDAWINSGFYVIDAGVLGLIPGDDCRFEYDILPVLATQNRLGAYQHPGFFQMCDTWRDLQKLQQLWRSETAPWVRWE